VSPSTRKDLHEGLARPGSVSVWAAEHPPSDSWHEGHPNGTPDSVPKGLPPVCDDGIGEEHNPDESENASDQEEEPTEGRIRPDWTLHDGNIPDSVQQPSDVRDRPDVILDPRGHRLAPSRPKGAR
jgi:hypothetical protein